MLLFHKKKNTKKKIILVSVVITNYCICKIIVFGLFTSCSSELACKITLFFLSRMLLKLALDKGDHKLKPPFCEDGQLSFTFFILIFPLSGGCSKSSPSCFWPLLRALPKHDHLFSITRNTGFC